MPCLSNAFLHNKYCLINRKCVSSLISSSPGKKSDAKAVANILATRGITVTPASGGRGGGAASAAAAQVAHARQRQNMQAPAPPAPVTTLNLNSAISIIPTTGSGNGRQQVCLSFTLTSLRNITNDIHIIIHE